MNTPETIDVSELRRAMGGELERRRCDGRIISYSLERGGSESLYGITGAINVRDALGLPLGDRGIREATAKRIMAYRDENGRFDAGSGPGHAVHMIVGALNILGWPAPADIGPLAPACPAELPAWLQRHDWNSTHKELCGQTIPLLASGRVCREWVRVFTDGIASRLHPDRPLEIWCPADAPSWRVISCIFHVLSAFDAGRIPYPEPELMLARLLGLRWDEAPDSESRTFCTDGDWAVLLLQLARRLPQHAKPIMEAVRRVSARRVRQWHEDRESILGDDTHDLYCYLWSTAVFQGAVREHYCGGVLRDTFNDPALFRLRK